MFGKKKKEKIIYTKDELKRAVHNKEPQIIVGGDLAQKLKCLAKLSPSKIVTIISILAAGTAATIANPVASGLFAASSLTATTGAASGTGVAAIVLASGLSVALILAILKGYDIELNKAGDQVIFKAK